MKYRYLEDVAISDCAFEAFGKNEQELFENAAQVVFAEMAITKKVPLKMKKKIRVSAATLEMLLYDFLAEIILLKDKSRMVFGKIVVKIKKPATKCGVQAPTKKKEWKATALLRGEKVSKLNNRIIRRDVKAVTWHLFKIEQKAKEIKATVVLDI